MNTSRFDPDYCLSWSLIDPRPCLYRIQDEVVVFWNGNVMTYNMAVALAADILFNTPISYAISDQIIEDYIKLKNLGIRFSPWVNKHANDCNNRAAYNYMRKTMHPHISKLGESLKNKKQALLWFNKELCINA